MQARAIRARRINRYDPEEYGVLSATWILASNDENPLMTYSGIKDRIGLDESYDLRGLVKRHGELFRNGAPQSQLEVWKEDMRAGKRIPSWIRNLSASQRTKYIEALSTGDVFRSQFRTGSKAPRSPIEIVDWGLQHIDRLRKASMEAREATIKSWQAWVVIVLSVLNIAVSVTLGLWGNN